jgi:hypothetical protein
LAPRNPTCPIPDISAEKSLTFIDECIEHIFQASRCDPVDWANIRSRVMQIGMFATTKEQKSAVNDLKRTADVATVQTSLAAIHRAFFPGRPDAHSRPRQ